VTEDLASDEQDTWTLALSASGIGAGSRRRKFAIQLAYRATPVKEHTTDEPGGTLEVVKELRALTQQEFERAAARLRNPAPGSRIEAAKKFGVDLTLLIEQLRLTPAERARKLEEASEELQQVRGIARRRA
jgi:hypothetical protein